MADKYERAFLVSAYTDPVVVKIIGRASYLNTPPVNDFLGRMLKQGKNNFVFDLKACSGMDSTFMGIVAGVASEARSQNPPGSVVMCGLEPRNMELVRNLGLHRIVKVEAVALSDDLDEPIEQLQTTKQDETKNARMILKAHNNLIDIDECNSAKFQDVISFLKNQVGSD